MNISFEFFPPKSVEGQSQLAEVAALLSHLSPRFFSVTFGAGGSTRTGTFDTVNLLHQKISIPVAPHLACIGSMKEEIVDILNVYREIGVRRIVALRGDLPSGMGQGGELQYASELVALIRYAMQDYFHIEVAAYPECHPQAKHIMDDISHFKHKVESGADSAITQYFFNPDAYFYFIDACAAQGIYIPIVPGIMPINHFDKLVRFSDRCGAEIPQWIRRRIAAYEGDPLSLQAFGFEVVYQLCEKLLAGGAPGLHFYTLNQAEVSFKLVENLNLAISPPTKKNLTEPVLKK